MAEKGRSKRQTRREVFTRFQNVFVSPFDFAKRAKPLNGKAKLMGLGIALCVYAVGFSVGYVGWTRHAVPDEMFAKLVWIWMVPATMAGVFCWQLMYSRYEYGLRQELKTVIGRWEGEQGVLWRYAPALSDEIKNDKLLREVMDMSQQGHIEKMAPEDYQRALKLIHAKLDDAQVDQNSLDAIEDNFATVRA